MNETESVDPTEEYDQTVSAGKREKTDSNEDALATAHRLLNAANDLKLLPRTGWLLAGVPNVESVADHSFATALLALALAQELNKAPHAQGLAEPLSVERVLKIALLHDLAESILTDLPKRAAEALTAALGADAKHRAERAAWEQIVAADPSAQEWMTLWQEYETGSTPEARLVKDADKLEMIHQAVRYQASGNLRLHEFLADNTWAYPVSSNFRRRLLAPPPSPLENI